MFSPSQYATGFRKNFSIVDNAKKHVGKELIISFDIKDFFPSITYADVLRMFVYMGYKLDVAHLLTKLCTNGDDVLPQGSPASPSISNLILLKVDKRLGKLAETIDCDYSRYADDITFSGSKKIKSIIPLVKGIINEEGFTVNEEKVRLRYSNQKQEVTGLTVNTKLSVSSILIKELENAIFFCSKYGVEDHMSHIGCDSRKKPSISSKTVKASYATSRLARPSPTDSSWRRGSWSRSWTVWKRWKKSNLFCRGCGRVPHPLPFAKNIATDASDVPAEFTFPRVKNYTTVDKEKHAKIF